MVDHIILVRPIESPQATISAINGFPLMQYLLLDDKSILSNSEDTPLFINFKSEVNIKGNLFTDTKSNHSLQKLVSNTIGRLENAQLKLSAKVVFKERLVVNSIDVQMSLTEFVRITKDKIFHIDGSAKKQYTQSMYLDGDVSVPNISSNNSKIYQLNDYTSLANSLTSLVVVDELAKVSSNTIFEKNFAASVVLMEDFHSEHGDLPMKYFNVNSLFHDILNARDQRIRSLIVDGNVRFVKKNMDKLKVQSTFSRTLNSFEPDTFFPQIVAKSHTNKQQTIEIGGEKTFISELNILSSHVNEFNKQIQMRNWFANSLRQQRTEKKVEQIIQGSGWQLINTISDNFQIDHTINGIHFAMSSNESSKAMFMHDNQLKTVVITSDISFSNDVRVNSRLDFNELRPCKVSKLAPDTLHLSQLNWEKLDVIGDVKLLKTILNESSSPTNVFHFLETTMSSQLNGIIRTDVTFKSNNIGGIFFNRITLNHPISVLVNGINLDQIFSDAVTQASSGSFQLRSIRSEKQLIAKETACNGPEFILHNSFIVELINDVNLKHLDSQLFNGNQYELSILPWQRILFLHDIVAQAAYVNENQTINGIIFADVYFIYSENLSQRSSISFENLQDINNQVTIVSDAAIDVKNINGFDWHFFIKNRFSLKNRSQLPIDKDSHEIVDGFPTFENLILIGDKIQIEQINDAVCEDIVLRNSIETQRILGSKEVPLLHIKKPFHTWKMSDFEFVSTYSKSILLNHLQLIEKLVIKSPFQLFAHFGANILMKFNHISINPYINDSQVQANSGNKTENNKTNATQIR